MDKDPDGCVFLGQPDGYYCEPYCGRYDPKIKMQAFEEVFGFKGDLAVEWKPALEEWEREVDKELESFGFSSTV